jgi:SSS family transporter
MANVDMFLLGAVAGYMLLQLGIAVYASRFINSETDYLLAGRQLGLLLTTFSIFATWFGAETVVASSGAVAAEGLAGGRAEPFGYALCLLLFAVLIAYRMRAQEYMTTSDFYRARFGRIAEKASVMLVIPTSLIWAAAQIVAFAHILSAVSGLDFSAALMLGTTIVVIYTTIGGFLGDVITDLVQGVFVIFGLLITAVFVVINMGGIEAALATLTPERLNIFSPDSSLGTQFDEWTIAVVGSLVSQEAISRILAARSPSVARRSCYSAAAMYFLFGLIPAFIGLAGASLMPLPADPDSFLPVLAKNILPVYIYVMFLGALISAILSTIDSTLLSVGALTGHNLIAPLIPGMNEEDKVRLQRLLVALAGFLAYVIATAGESIYALIEASSSFGSSGLLVCLIFGLWTRLGSFTAALVTMATGVVSSYLFQYVYAWDSGYLASLALCIIVYGIIAFLERARQQPSTA